MFRASTFAFVAFALLQTSSAGIIGGVVGHVTEGIGHVTGHVGSQVGGEVGGEIGGQVGGEIGGQVGGGVGGHIEVGGGIGGGVGGGLGGHVEVGGSAIVDPEVAGSVAGSVAGAVAGAVQGAVENAVENVQQHLPGGVNVETHVEVKPEGGVAGTGSHVVGVVVRPEVIETVVAAEVAGAVEIPQLKESVVSTQVHIEPHIAAGVVSEFVKDVAARLDKLVVVVVKQIEAATERFAGVLRLAADKAGAAVKTATVGVVTDVQTGIKAQADLIQKTQDATIKIALTEGSNALDLLLQNVLKTTTQAQGRFQDVLLEFHVASQEVLDSVEEKILDKAAEARNTALALADSAAAHGAGIDICLPKIYDQIDALSQAAVAGAVECVDAQLAGADKISTGLTDVFQHTFGGVQPVIGQLNECSSGLKDELTFDEHRQAIRCLHKATRHIKLAAVGLTTEAGVQECGSLGGVAEFRANLRTCSAQNLDKLSADLGLLAGQFNECLKI